MTKLNELIASAGSATTLRFRSAANATFPVVELVETTGKENF